MTDSVLIGLAIAGGIITVVGALIGIGYRLGVLSRRTDENTEDIVKVQKDVEDVRKEFVVDLKELRKDLANGERELSKKMDKILETMSDLCERIGKTEQRLDDKHSS